VGSGGTVWFPDPSFCGAVEGEVQFITSTSPSCLDDLLSLLHQSSKPSFTAYNFLGFRRNYGITPENNLQYYRAASILLKHLIFLK